MAISQSFAPSSFMPIMGGTSMMNIPGTSYWSPITGATSSFYMVPQIHLVLAVWAHIQAFRQGLLLQAGAWVLSQAVLQISIITGGTPTGFATSVSDIAGLTAGSYLTSAASTGTNFGQNFILPVAGVISGIGGLMQSVAPYMGSSGLAAIVAGNLLEGTGSAALNAYSNVTGRITTNADAIFIG